MSRLFSLLTTLLLAAMVPNAYADDDADREALRFELEHLLQSGFLSSSDVSIASGELLLQIYERRDFSPTWNDQRQIEELIAAIRATADDGLDPSDYHVERVEFAYNELLEGRLTSPEEWAVQDLILTDSLARLGYHQLFGKVNPYTVDPHWNFRRELNGIDPATAIQDAIDSPSLTEFLGTVFPRGWMYRQLQAGLAEYREIADNGGWPLVPGGPVLEPGAIDDRMPVLARRLAASGDLEPLDDPDALTAYDEVLAEGVRRFQERHGIDVDAILGPNTLRTMNVPVGQRIRQLEINLERARWVLDDLEDDFVLVNIAGFRAYVLRGREVVWETKVQVGSTYHQSPIFRDEMTYVVLNPTWTVPYGIATREILPQIQRSPDYLDTRDFDLKDRGGQLVDASGVDWSAVSARNFPYWLVQRPGPDNALGRIKFMFPNEHAVYLHDTPSKFLFGKAERAFSHGCIRVENPVALAAQLLSRDGWNEERILQALETGKTKTVFLSTPMPVLLLYWTAMVGPDGIVRFYNDVYSRDARIARALDAPFRLDAPGQ